MQDVVDEFQDLVLPDQRLVSRVQSFVTAAWRAPSESFPRMLQDAAQLEGGYRLLSNPRVTFEALQAPHVARTAERALPSAEVVVVHDTTEIEAAYADPSEVGYLQTTGRTGYRAHISLALGVEPNRTPRPFGVLSVQADFRTQPPNRTGKRKSKNGWTTARSRDKAFLRWERGIEASAETLKGCQSVVHVADREADSYPLFCKVQELGHGCVIRLRNDRRARSADDDDAAEEWSSLAEIAASIQGTFERPVPLSRRGHKAAPARLKTHPPREARTALLHYGASAVEIKKPHYQPAVLPASLHLWLVRVWEPAPPQGEEPVQWLLVTTEPCETAAEIMRVVDLYRARWVIEEFFKALKTGCALEERQLETRHALLNTLALFLPIAVHLLWLRTCARDEPDAPATEAFTPLQLEVLGHVSHRKLPPNPSVVQALWALAGYGGHIANNGWPGWQVLGRAFARLVDAVTTWQIAQHAAAKM
jgi:Transposase DNA-binding/Transposase DDE domain